MLDKSPDFASLDYDVPVTRPTKINKKLYAKALYDNVADSPDELAFRKGEILTVIEQDTDSLVGWWLCILRGRQGLCPGNRLRIINSYDSGCFSPSPASSPCPSLAASTATLNSSICSADIYENTSILSGGSGGGSCNTSVNGSSNISNISSTGSSSGIGSGGGGQSSGSGSGCISASQTQLNTASAISNNLQHQQHQQHQTQKQGTRRSWHVSPNKVITPQRHGDVYIYNLPQQHQLQQQQQQNFHLSLPNNQQQQHHQQQQQQHHQQQLYQNLPGKPSTLSLTSLSSLTLNNEFENYDIPKPAVPVNTIDSPRIIRTMSYFNTTAPIQEENYDVPRPLHAALLQQQHQNSLTPSSSNSSLLTSDSLSLSFSSSNRSSLANMPDYDIPRRNPIPVRAVLQQQQQQQHQLLLQQHQQLQRPLSRTSMNGNSSSFDYPLTAQNGMEKTAASLVAKELPLELNSALETLAKLQSETTTSIMRLLSFVSPDWRTRDKLEPILMEVKLAAVRLRTALHDLAEFGEGTLGNATKLEDRTLVLKLNPIIRALRDANKLVSDSCELLEANGGWSLEYLARNDDKGTIKPPDSLDRLVACAQTLTEDVRSTTSFIQGNASLLFKRHLTEVIEELPENNGDIDGRCGGTDVVDNSLIIKEASDEQNWLEDYDYVSFESKDAAAKKNSALREVIPENVQNNFDNALKTAENTVINTANVNNSGATTGVVTPTTPNGRKSFIETLNEKDKMLVRYYAVQISTHMGNLRQAIDSFLETVEKNQPPKYFIAYGKFVVVSAHNLVATGDIVHRNMSKPELKEKILRCTDNLSEALKTCVMKSKLAAAHFPSVTAVQEMVDSVVDISHLASDLKTVMLHAVEMTIKRPQNV